MKIITDTMEVSRSNQYRERTGRRRYQKKSGDEKYLLHIRTIIEERPTYGYRRVTALLNRKFPVNHKKVYRIMRANDLLLPKYTGKVVRSHEGTIITLMSNMRWCSDGFEILCMNGERVRVAFAMDCSDREVIFVATNKGITSEMINGQ